MKIKLTLKLFFLSILVFSLSFCYRMREYKFLNVTFDDVNIKGSFLKKYIDSIRNKDLVIPSSIKDNFLHGSKLSESERLVYFKDKPQEWYLISFDISPCWIEYIYNKQLSPVSINKREFLGDEQLKRIEMRFRNEVIKPAESYGREHHLPDSVLYNDSVKK